MPEVRFTQQTSPDPARVIRRCGWATLLALGLLLPLSYGIAAVSPAGTPQPEEVAAFHRVVAQAAIPWPGVVEGLNRYLAGDSPLAAPMVRGVAFGVPLLVMTAAFIWVAVVLRSNEAAVDETVVSLLFRMAVAFAAVNVLAYPMFTQDLWFSVAWGRMVAAGHNPYYEFLTDGALSGLPLAYFPMLMTYGPLWTVLSGGLAALARHNVVLEFLLFKLALALLWVLSLVLIRRTLVGCAAGRRALAICLFGWLPISHHASIAEGHNDVAMVFFLLLWMYLSARRRMLSPVAIAASALCKYVTVPLAAVELFNTWRVKAPPWRSYAVGLVTSGLLSILLFAAFWRGGDFFAGLVDTSAVVLFTPAHAIGSITRKLDVPISEEMTANVMRALFAGIILHYALRYARAPRFPRFAELTLAIMCGVLFAGAKHMWPWYLIWVVAPAAIAAHSRLLRLVLPAAVLGPFLSFYWMIPAGFSKGRYFSIAFFALVAAAMLLMPRTREVEPTFV